MIVPSSSEPEPEKLTESDSLVKVGETELIVAFGYAFTTSQLSTDVDQAV